MALGFIDFEYNSDTDLKRYRQVFDIIEVGFYVYDGKSLIDEYHAYVKPVKNEGKLFERIVELTDIQQSQVDFGVSIEFALTELNKRIHKYRITEIVAWGSYDAFALRKNLQNITVNKKKYKGMIYRIGSKIVDLGELVKKRFELKYSISLINTCHICDLDRSKFHNALDDSNMLFSVFDKLSSGICNEEKLLKYKELDSKRKPGYTIKLIDGEFSLVESTVMPKKTEL